MNNRSKKDIIIVLSVLFIMVISGFAIMVHNVNGEANNKIILPSLKNISGMDSSTNYNISFKQIAEFSYCLVNMKIQNTNYQVFYFANSNYPFDKDTLSVNGKKYSIYSKDFFYSNGEYNGNVYEGALLSSNLKILELKVYGSFRYVGVNAYALNELIGDTNVIAVVNNLETIPLYKVGDGYVIDLNDYIYKNSQKINTYTIDFYAQSSPVIKNQDLIYSINKFTKDKNSDNHIIDNILDYINSTYGIDNGRIFKIITSYKVFGDYIEMTIGRIFLIYSLQSNAVVYSFMITGELMKYSNLLSDNVDTYIVIKFIYDFNQFTNESQIGKGKVYFSALSYVSMVNNEGKSVNKAYAISFMYVDTSKVSSGSIINENQIKFVKYSNNQPMLYGIYYYDWNYTAVSSETPPEFTYSITPSVITPNSNNIITINIPDTFKVPINDVFIRISNSNNTFVYVSHYSGTIQHISNEYIYTIDLDSNKIVEGALYNFSLSLDNLNAMIEVNNVIGAYTDVQFHIKAYQYNIAYIDNSFEYVEDLTYFTIRNSLNKNGIQYYYYITNSFNSSKLSTYKTNSLTDTQLNVQLIHNFIDAGNTLNEGVIYIIFWLGSNVNQYSIFTFTYENQDKLSINTNFYSADNSGNYGSTLRTTKSSNIPLYSSSQSFYNNAISSLIQYENDNDISSSIINTFYQNSEGVYHIHIVNNVNSKIVINGYAPSGVYSMNYTIYQFYDGKFIKDKQSSFSLSNVKNNIIADGHSSTSSSSYTLNSLSEGLYGFKITMYSVFYHYAEEHSYKAPSQVNYNHYITIYGFFIVDKTSPQFSISIVNSNKNPLSFYYHSSSWYYTNNENYYVKNSVYDDTYIKEFLYYINTDGFYDFQMENETYNLEGGIYHNYYHQINDILQLSSNQFDSGNAIIVEDGYIEEDSLYTYYLGDGNNYPYHIYVDTIKPIFTANFGYHYNGQYLYISGTSGQYKFNFYDNQSGLAIVRVKLGSNYLINDDFVNSTSGYLINRNNVRKSFSDTLDLFSNFPSGSNDAYLTIYVKDLSGNVYERQYSVIKDTTLPTLTITYDDGKGNTGNNIVFNSNSNQEYYIGGSKLNITFTANDDNVIHNITINGNTYSSNSVVLSNVSVNTDKLNFIVYVYDLSGNFIRVNLTFISYGYPSITPSSKLDGNYIYTTNTLNNEYVINQGDLYANIIAGNNASATISELYYEINGNKYTISDAVGKHTYNLTIDISKLTDSNNEIVIYVKNNVNNSQTYISDLFIDNTPMSIISLTTGTSVYENAGTINLYDTFDEAKNSNADVGGNLYLNFDLGSEANILSGTLLFDNYKGDYQKLVIYAYLDDSSNTGSGSHTYSFGYNIISSYSISLDDLVYYLNYMYDTQHNNLILKFVLYDAVGNTNIKYAHIEVYNGGSITISYTFDKTINSYGIFSPELSSFTFKVDEGDKIYKVDIGTGNPNYNVYYHYTASSYSNFKSEFTINVNDLFHFSSPTEISDMASITLTDEYGFTYIPDIIAEEGDCVAVNGEFNYVYDNKSNAPTISFYRATSGQSTSYSDLTEVYSDFGYSYLKVSASSLSSISEIDITAYLVYNNNNYEITTVKGTQTITDLNQGLTKTISLDNLQKGIVDSYHALAYYLGIGKIYYYIKVYDGADNIYTETTKQFTYEGNGASMTYDYYYMGNYSGDYLNRIVGYNYPSYWKIDYNVSGLYYSIKLVDYYYNFIADSNHVYHFYITIDADKLVYGSSSESVSYSFYEELIVDGASGTGTYPTIKYGHVDYQSSNDYSDISSNSGAYFTDISVSVIVKKDTIVNGNNNWNTITSGTINVNYGTNVRIYFNHIPDNINTPNPPSGGGTGGAVSNNINLNQLNGGINYYSNLYTKFVSLPNGDTYINIRSLSSTDILSHNVMYSSYIYSLNEKTDVVSLIWNKYNYIVLSDSSNVLYNGKYYFGSENINSMVDGGVGYYSQNDVFIYEIPFVRLDGQTYNKLRDIYHIGSEYKYIPIIAVKVDNVNVDDTTNLLYYKYGQYLGVLVYKGSDKYLLLSLPSNNDKSFNVLKISSFEIPYEFRLITNNKEWKQGKLVGNIYKDITIDYDYSDGYNIIKIFSQGINYTINVNTMADNSYHYAYLNETGKLLDNIVYLYWNDRDNGTNYNINIVKYIDYLSSQPDYYFIKMLSSNGNVSGMSEFEKSIYYKVSSGSIIYVINNLYDDYLKYNLISGLNFMIGADESSGSLEFNLYKVGEYMLFQKDYMVYNNYRMMGEVYPIFTISSETYPSEYGGFITEWKTYIKIKSVYNVVINGLKIVGTNGLYYISGNLPNSYSGKLNGISVLLNGNTEFNNKSMVAPKGIRLFNNTKQVYSSDNYGLGTSFISKYYLSVSLDNDWNTYDFSNNPFNKFMIYSYMLIYNINLKDEVKTDKDILLGSNREILANVDFNVLNETNNSILRNIMGDYINKGYIVYPLSNNNGGLPYNDIVNYKFNYGNNTTTYTNYENINITIKNNFMGLFKYKIRFFDTYTHTIIESGIDLTSLPNSSFITNNLDLYAVKLGEKIRNSIKLYSNQPETINLGFDFGNYSVYGEYKLTFDVYLYTSTGHLYKEYDDITYTFNGLNYYQIPVELPYVDNYLVKTHIRKLYYLEGSTSENTNGGKLVIQEDKVSNWKEVDYNIWRQLTIQGIANVENVKPLYIDGVYVDNTSLVAGRNYKLNITIEGYLTSANYVIYKYVSENSKSILKNGELSFINGNSNYSYYQLSVGFTEAGTYYLNIIFYDMFSNYVNYTVKLVVYNKYMNLPKRIVLNSNIERGDYSVMSYGVEGVYRLSYVDGSYHLYSQTNSSVITIDTTNLELVKKKIKLFGIFTIGEKYEMPLIVSGLNENEKINYVVNTNKVRVGSIFSDVRIKGYNDWSSLFGVFKKYKVNSMDVGYSDNSYIVVSSNKPYILVYYNKLPFGANILSP